MALEVETRFAAWADGILSRLNDEQLQHMMNTEFGGMNEVLVDLYADTGDERWLKLSYAFEHRAFITPLERHQDDLAGKHGNTQVPKLIGSAERYRYTGQPADLLAAAFFWDRVTQHHSFSSGGHGTDEYFGPPDRLNDRVDGRTCETCNTYNMLKLTRRLFSFQPDVHYADYHERALFNHILASIDPEDGRVCYMVPVGRGVTHEYQDMDHSWTCDVGTGMESPGLHGLGLYYEAGDRLWGDLFAPSTAEGRAAGGRIARETDCPGGEAAERQVGGGGPRAATCRSGVRDRQRGSRRLGQAGGRAGELHDGCRPGARRHGTHAQREADVVLPFAPAHLLDLLGSFRPGGMGSPEGGIRRGGGAAAASRGRDGCVAPTRRNGVRTAVQLSGGGECLPAAHHGPAGTFRPHLVLLRPSGRARAPDDADRDLLLRRPPWHPCGLHHSRGRHTSGRAADCVRRAAAFLRRGVRRASRTRAGQDQGHRAVRGEDEEPDRHGVRFTDNSGRRAALIRPALYLMGLCNGGARSPAANRVTRVTVHTPTPGLSLGTPRCNPIPSALGLSRSNTQSSIGQRSNKGGQDESSSDHRRTEVGIDRVH